MNQTSQLIRIESVSKEYEGAAGGPGLSVLRDIQLEIGAGETIAIIGPSGSGKSTLLNLIGGLDSPTSGNVFIDNEDLSELDESQLARIRNEKIGFVFQDHHLLPQCSILENVLLPTLAYHSSAGDDAVQRANALLDRVGLSDRLNHRPAQLSGGERQRVAYVRSLINQPLVLLADEPTGALDRENAERLMKLLVEINKERGLTSIVVTHALEWIHNMDRAFELKDGILCRLEGRN